MRLPGRMRAALKEPLGCLMPEPSITRKLVLSRVSAPAITVGDRTTERLLGWQVPVRLQIVDGAERRGARAPPPLPPGTVQKRCRNPAGALSDEAVEAVREGLSSEAPVRILVDGEEDLLALPACALAPDGASLFYGQPGEGMVAVRVDAGVRRKTQKMIDVMRAGNDEKVAV